MNKMRMDIDLVYFWVDGNDPKWRAKHDAFCGKTSGTVETNGINRFANNDELKYSLRSVAMYAPWIRKIFIITDDQVPVWLDTSNPKVKIIDHKDILPVESLPCFNSCLIGHYAYRTPGLAEHFLLGNDDTYINREVAPGDFFTSDGLPIVRLRRMYFRKLRWSFRENVRKKTLSNYRRTLQRASQLVSDKFGHYYTGIPHHNINALLKSVCRDVAENIMRDEFASNNKNHIRNDDDVQNVVFSYVALAEKRGKLRYVTDKESMIVKIHKDKHYERLDKFRPMLFCMNDSEYANDSGRAMSKAYLEKRFPDKSEFEK